MSSKSIYTFHQTNHNLSEIFSMEYIELVPPTDEEYWSRLTPVGKEQVLSPEMRQIISATFKGKPKSEEQRAKMRAAWEKRRLNYPMTDETRKNISEAAKKRPPASDELKQKRADNQRGKKHSDETRKKMSESRKKLYAQRM